MKKIVLVALVSLSLFSCGKEKKSEEVKQPEKVNKFVVKMNAVYQEDDSLSIVYKVDTYFQYEKAVSLKVKGSPELQNLSVDLPVGVAAENLQITMSTNKNQKKLTVNNIQILNDNKEVFNVTNQVITDYFDFNPGIVLEADRSFTLKFGGEYPPGLTGNQNLEGEFLK